MTGKEKNRVEELIPEGLLEAAVPFIDFLKKYYEFMEEDTYSPSSVINKDQITRNVESTSRLFLQRLYTEIGDGIYINKDNLDADVANLIKNANILYEAKGTLESIRVLFRIVFGEDIDIYLPRDFILKPSEGNWDRQYSFIASLDAGDPFDMVGEFVEITTQFPGQPQQTISAEVVSIESTAKSNYYEVFVTKNTINVFYYGATVSFENVQMTIESIADRLLFVVDQGTQFSLSTTYDIKNYSRNWFADFVTPESYDVPAGFAAGSGSSTLDFVSGAGISVGDYIWGDSAIPADTTIATQVDSDTFTLSTPLVATIPTGSGKTLSVSSYPKAHNDRLSSLFAPLIGTRRIQTSNPLKVFDTETFTITPTTDGLSVERIVRSDKTIDVVSYDQTKSLICTNVGGGFDYDTNTDSDVYPAPDPLVNWDKVIEEHAKITLGDSSGSLYSYLTATNTFNLIADSAPTFNATIPEGFYAASYSFDSSGSTTTRLPYIDSGTTTLFLSSVSGIQVGDFVYGDSSIAAGTTIASIAEFNNEVEISTPLIAILPTDSSVGDRILTLQRNIADSSTTVFVTSTSGLAVGDLVEGAGFDSDTIVTAIVSATEFTIDQPHNGYADSATLSINNHQRGDINHDGTIDLDDLEILTKRYLSYEITDANLSWVKNVIEGEMPSGIKPSAESFTIITNNETLAGTTTLNLDNTRGLKVGFAINGLGVDSGTTITAIPTAETITLSSPTTVLIPGDSSPTTYTIGTLIGSDAKIRPTNLGDSNGIVDYSFQNYGYDYPDEFVGVVDPDNGGEVFTGVYQSTPIAFSEALYTDTKGHLSDIIKLQDGSFYQDFSYVVKSDKQISEFEDILYKTVHPAGMKVFGELVAGQNISVETEVSVVVDSRFNQLLQNTFATTDSDFKNFTLGNTAAGAGGDSAAVSETIGKGTGKAFYDTASGTLLYVDLGYTVDDVNYFNTGETFVLDLDTVNLPDSASISAIGIGSQNVSATFFSTGAYTGSSSSGGSFSQNWHDDGDDPSETPGSGFELFATLSSGTAPDTGTLGSWVSLGSNQSYTAALGGIGTRQSVLAIQIRDAVSQVVVGTGTLTLYVEST